MIEADTIAPTGTADGTPAADTSTPGTVSAGDATLGTAGAADEPHEDAAGAMISEGGPDHTPADTPAAPTSGVDLSHLYYLGMKAKDRVSGSKGIIVNVEYHLSGTIHFVLQPKLNKNGDIGLAQGIDFPALKFLNDGIKNIVSAPDNCTLLLGQTVEDRITGASGILTRLIYQLNGCVHGLVECKPSGMLDNTKRFCVDHKRLKFVDEGVSINSEDPIAVAATGCSFGATDVLANWRE